MKNPDSPDKVVIDQPAYGDLSLVDKLRRWYALSGDGELKEAADTIDAQRHQIARLQEDIQLSHPVELEFNK